MSLPTKLEISAKKICNSDQVLVYGYNNCFYEKVKRSLASLSIFKKTFNWECGDRFIRTETIEGSPIEKIHYDLGKGGVLRECKSAIVNIVFENLKRKRQGKKIIPILFCIDVNDNQFANGPEVYTSKIPKFNDLMTHKEIRRAYKLCVQHDDPEIRAVAQKTFRFVKVIYDEPSSTIVDLEQIGSPWHHQDWDRLWENRMKISKSSEDVTKTKFWRKELAGLKTKLDEETFVDRTQLQTKHREEIPKTTHEPSPSTAMRIFNALSFGLFDIPSSWSTEQLL